MNPLKVANPTKPYGVAKTLFKNKEKLIEFLENFEVIMRSFEVKTRGQSPPTGGQIIRDTRDQH